MKTETPALLEPATTAPRRSTRFPNYAGRADCDELLAAELAYAGIKVERLPELCRDTQGEVKSVVVGTLPCNWSFHRAWYYWIAKGPGIPLKEATELHEAHGKDVRVDGHCGCPSPLEWFKGLGCGAYHVDSFEGLKALAETLNALTRTL